MTRTVFLAAAFSLSLAGAACSEAPTGQTRQAAAPERPSAGLQTAIFAGGCFWCTEADFEKVPGVVDAVSGYTGGRTRDPTYAEVTSGATGHYEAVRVTYDPSRVTYRQLVDLFWRTIDPTDAGGQFCDRGDSYSPAVFVQGEAQRREALASREAAARRVQPFRTPVLNASTFWPAEAYHQDYYKKNALRYRVYRTGCGRDARLRAVWGGR